MMQRCSLSATVKASFGPLICFAVWRNLTGFHEAGITSVVGVDHDASALETWAANFPGYARLADLQDPVQIDELVDLCR